MPALPIGNTSDWSFLRWDTSADGGTTFNGTYDFSTPVTSNVTLYARWVRPIADMVWVPKGSFIMGDSSVTGSTTAAKVDMEGFYIGRTPVTQAQYQAAVGSNPSRFTGANRSNNPVESVTWTAANTFRNGDGFRLPTEAEWEYAAKGGHFGALKDNYTYSGSNNAAQVAWYNITVRARPFADRVTQPVASGISPNALGIFDMSGNVAEWVSDVSGTNRITRGGSWNSNAGNVRNVVRNVVPQSTVSWDIGFRLARTPTAADIW